MIRRLFLATLALSSCAKSPPTPPPAPHPSILLVTLDTTRSDAIGTATPSFNALASRGMRFMQAYATVPQTLPSHTSMLTGLYPGGHGVHENARYLADNQPTVATRLHDTGYRTAAFVSAFALARRFGLGRGFDVYDEEFGPDHAERPARETTDRVLAFLAQPSQQPLFLWVHYYDPHYPYTPPEPYRTRYANNPYLGEVASMDEQLGRLVQEFERRAPGPRAIILASDHGEGLGEHGEAQHGNLLYQATMHVPLVIVGPGVAAATSNVPVSTRRVYHTILDWAGIDRAQSLRAGNEHVLLGEAMKPFLDYGWQPQVMALEGRRKTILAGRTEVYDVIADQAETHDLSASANITRETRAALRDYPIPSADAAKAPLNLDDESQRKLASLGYVSSGTKPVVRSDAPRPADMALLFPVLDRASGLFVRNQYAEAIPLLEQIQKRDPHNLDAALRLASAHSALGQDAQAIDAFDKAEAIAPGSRDVRTYLALHYARGREWERAVPMLKQVVEEEPDRLPALEALAVIRERQDHIDDAVRLRRKIYAMRAATPAELSRLGQMQMAIGDTTGAIDSFEKAGAGHDLELGVLYMASGRYENARVALDRVPPSHPGYAMALFKRAQVSVLLQEPDQTARIARAREYADATTRTLIDRERLFR